MLVAFQKEITLKGFACPQHGTFFGVRFDGKSLDVKGTVTWSLGFSLRLALAGRVHRYALLDSRH